MSCTCLKCVSLEGNGDQNSSGSLSHRNEEKYRISIMGLFAQTIIPFIACPYWLNFGPDLALQIFFVFFFFLLEDNCFTPVCWFLPYINMNQPQVKVSPSLPLEAASHLSHYPAPLHYPTAPDLSCPHHNSNFPLMIWFYIRSCMFQCYSLKGGTNWEEPQITSNLLNKAWHSFSRANEWNNWEEI